MKDAKKGYKAWAAIYDSNANRTRDLEKKVAQNYFANKFYSSILEIGSGTGKNSVWLKEICQSLICVDFSEDMQALAKSKINDPKVNFVIADINLTWSWLNQSVDLIVCSLVIEHIQDPTTVFEQAAKYLNPNGSFYLCEFHPYKHLIGSKARYKQGKGEIEVESYLHHISKINSLATKQNLILETFNEWFDDDNETLPRLVSYIFKKKSL